jgi:hypothetical protein
VSTNCDEPSGGAELDVLGGDADHQHRLAQTGWSDQCQRPRLLDEGGIQVAQHDLPLELRTEAEVELLDGGRIRKASLAQPFLSSGVGSPTLCSSSKPCRKSA